jgi:hypothetical protein
MSAHDFEVSVFGHRLAVLTDHGSVRTYLDRYLLPWLPRSAPGPVTPGLTLRVVRSQRSQGFDAYAGDDLIAAGAGLPAIFDLLQCRIDERVARSQPGFATVHAGVVAWKGRAALVAGSSQSGKTTLVKELLKRGAVYYSDEYAFLDAEGQVHPYPRPLMVRNGRGRCPTLPSAWDAASAGSPAPVRLILFLEWRRGGQWDVRQIPQSEALLLLLQNAPQEMAEFPEIVGLLQTAVASANCYAGFRGEARGAAAHVIELLAGSR